MKIEKPTKNDRYLIIVAHDFGMTRGINRGIIDAFKDGVITGASLLVTMPYVDEAVRLAKENPHLPVGLHLYLTNGYCDKPGVVFPVLPARDVLSLVDKDGKLMRGPEKVLPKAKTNEIIRELSAQLERFLKFGINLAHIDTHYDIVAYPPICEAVLKMAQKQSVPFRFLNNKVAKEKAKKNNLPISDWYHCLYLEDRVPVSAKTVIEIIKSLKPGITDLACHLGYVDGELETYTELVEERELELDSLRDRNVKEILLSESIELINYYDLKKMRMNQL
ncbi:MAG: ChbG/HpnK family deacetylase [Pelolinea sp.]|nr:ChbG/HpnK family deacetylase [Pelolinea sp.]